MKRPAIVSYSDSSESEDSESRTVNTPPPAKKRKLPPLVPQLTVPIPVDDPSKHQGRVRTTPHVEGQWAAYVYVPISLNSFEHAKLRKVVRKAFGRARERVPSLHTLGSRNTGKTEGPGTSASDEDEFMGDLHVSLTRPFFLRAHQREEVKRAVRAVAKSHKSFTASFATFSELTNDERTRTFLCMEVGGGHNEFRALSEALTPTLRAFKQKEYYDQPRFHASFAWALLTGSAQSLLAGDSTKLAANLSNEDLDDRIPARDAPVPLETPATSTGSASSSLSFSTAPNLPPDLVADLNAEFAKVLTSQACAFEVRELKVRIGKDVFGWSMG